MNVQNAMHWLDLAFFAVVIVGAGIGAYSGVLRQIVRLLTYAIALYATTYLHGHIANSLGLTPAKLDLVHGRLDSAPSALPHLLCLGVTSMTVYLAVYVATLLFQKAVKAIFVKPQDRASRSAMQAIGLQTLDRIAGGLTGAVMGAVIAGTAV